MKKEPEGFPEFWAVWKPYARKTDGRGLARETFAKHVRAGADPQDIINGAAWFLRTLKERDRDFVPLSSTWMNRGTYEDDCILEYKRLTAMDQPKHPDNVVNMVQPETRPSEQERAAHVERMKMKLRGNA
jgi:hypothetical protein